MFYEFNENQESEGYQSSFNYEIIKSYRNNPDNKDYVITLPHFWMVMIDDFNHKLSTQNPLPLEVIQKRNWVHCETLGVVYPLEVNKSLAFPLTLVNLIVVTVYGTNLEHSSIAIGTSVVNTIPYLFGKQLQHFLTTGEL